MTSTLTQDLDLDGNVDVDSILDLAALTSGHSRGMLVEKSPKRAVKVDVNDRVNLYVAVKLKVVGRRRGLGRGPQISIASS